MCVLHVLGNLWQLAIGGLGGPLVDGVDSASLVTEVDLGMLIVVVLLAGLHKIISKADRAGAVQPVADLPGDVAGIWVTDLVQELRQA